MASMALTCNGRDLSGVCLPLLGLAPLPSYLVHHINMPVGCKAQIKSKFQGSKHSYYYARLGRRIGLWFLLQEKLKYSGSSEITFLVEALITPLFLVYFRFFPTSVSLTLQELVGNAPATCPGVT